MVEAMNVEVNDIPKGDERTVNVETTVLIEERKTVMDGIKEFVGKRKVVLIGIGAAVLGLGLVMTKVMSSKNEEILDEDDIEIDIVE